MTWHAVVLDSDCGRFKLYQASENRVRTGWFLGDATMNHQAYFDTREEAEQEAVKRAKETQGGMFA